MKNNLIYIVALVFCFTGCSNSDSPKPVAEKFLKAFRDHDYEKAAQYGTKETAKMLKQLKKIEEIGGEKVVLNNKALIITSEEIAGNKAVIYFKQEGDDSEEKITLEKVIVDESSKKREWKVALSKTDVRVPPPFDGPAVPDSLRKDLF